MMQATSPHLKYVLLYTLEFSRPTNCGQKRICGYKRRTQWYTVRTSSLVHKLYKNSLLALSFIRHLLEQHFVIPLIQTKQWSKFSLKRHQLLKFFHWFKFMKQAPFCISPILAICIKKAEINSVTQLALEATDFLSNRYQ